MVAKPIYITYLNYNHKIFYMFYDVNKSKNIFLELDENNNLKAPAAQDLIDLNNIYNLEHNVVYERIKVKDLKSKLIQEKKEDYSGINLKHVYIKFTATVLSAITIFGTNIYTEKNFVGQNIKDTWYISNSGIISYLFNKKPLDELSEEEKINFYNRMIRALEENENIPQNLKEILLNDEYIKNDFEHLISISGKYMNQDEVVNKLKNVKLNFKDTIDNKIDNMIKNNQYEIAADYHRETNSITMFRVSSFDVFNEKNIKTLVHELTHLTGGPRSLRFGSSICEGLTEQMCSERNRYQEERFCAQMLQQLVGNDVLLRFYYQNDIALLLSSLSNIYGSTEDAVRLIKLCDSINEIGYPILRGYIDLSNEKDTKAAQDYKDNLNTRDHYFEEFADLYAKYWEIRYNIPFKYNVIFAKEYNRVVHNEDLKKSCYFLGLDKPIRHHGIHISSSECYKLYPEEFDIKVDTGTIFLYPYYFTINTKNHELKYFDDYSEKIKELKSHEEFMADEQFYLDSELLRNYKLR